MDGRRIKMEKTGTAVKGEEEHCFLFAFNLMAAFDL